VPCLKKSYPPPPLLLLPPSPPPLPQIDYPGERTAAAFTSIAKQHMPNYTVKLNQKTWEAFDSDADLARAVVFTDKAEPTAMIKVRAPLPPPPAR
jgi:hypothetical protein